VRAASRLAFHVYYSTGRYDDAVRCLSEAIDLQSGRARHHAVYLTLIAEFQVECGRYDDALATLDQARQTLAMVPEAKRNEAPVAAARAALDLAEQAKTLGPITELEQKVAANPLDHQARFDLALALNGKGRRMEALEQLIAIVKRDRKWNDDGARKQLVQFFDAWGTTDEAAVEGRRRLSSILFA